MMTDKVSTAPEGSHCPAHRLRSSTDALQSA